MRRCLRGLKYIDFVVTSFLQFFTPKQGKNESTSRPWVSTKHDLEVAVEVTTQSLMKKSVNTISITVVVLFLMHYMHKIYEANVKCAEAEKQRQHESSEADKQCQHELIMLEKRNAILEKENNYLRKCLHEIHTHYGPQMFALCSKEPTDV